ncbi:EcsC family protein [Lysobacter hankyongensis]|uniref:EcsC family protein n=1 Tax=Lysobacter hankyongensis TaxID=1176535 RepID=A0ABP9C912_9GAMM
MSGQDVIPAAAAQMPQGIAGHDLAGQDLAGQDLADLERAVALLTTPSLTVRIAALVGTPVEKLLAKLPKGASRRIHGAVEAALEKSAQVALWKMDDAPERKASTRMHKAVAAATGAAGGFFGWTGLLVEIPASTTVMLRAIADVARSEGFSLADPSVQRDCIAVFSLGGTGAADDAAETGYYATRAMIEAATEGAGPALIAHAAKRSVAASEAGALLTKVVKAVAARLGVVFSEKAAAQMVPIVGAAGGATINALFTDHFQNMARGHFIVRRLEARHGAAAIEAEFRRLARARRAPPVPVLPKPMP